MQQLLAVQLFDHIHLGQNIRHSDRMVRQEAQREYSGHQESFQHKTLLAVLCVRVTFSDLHGPQLQCNLHVENDEDQEQDTKEHYHSQVGATSQQPLIVEMEADLVAWVFLLVTNKEHSGSNEENHPDDVAGYAAPQHLLYAEDPDWLDDLQVAVQADQAEEGDAGIHVDVEEDTHHFAQEVRPLFVMVVDPQWQTQDQE